MKAFIFDPLWKTLITETLSKSLLDNDVEVVVVSDLTPIQQNKALYEGDEDRILCVNPDYVKWNLTVDDYKNIPNLKAILGAATSFSWINTSFADQNNIPIVNIRNFSTQAVAEWAITMMFNVARKIPLLIKNGFPLDFDKDFMKYKGQELNGRTAAIIGLGHNGLAIAERLTGLGMNVVYWSKHSRDSRYEYLELDELFKRADVIFPTFAHNQESDNLITDELLDLMKKNAIVVDIIKLTNRNKILHLVENDTIFGYAFEAEPRTFTKYVGNVWAAPEYAWVTEGSFNNVMTKWVENMINASKNEFPNRVN
ncbi:MAG: hypothetical protein H6793_03635 [Candidatus Nomurabacteria bacterium]|nr:MAG: hypothetical protein H6793_03635 [Candidatus Nomurabacteria bacterium]